MPAAWRSQEFSHSFTPSTLEQEFNTRTGTHRLPINTNDTEGSSGNGHDYDMMVYQKTVQAIPFYPPAWLFGVVWSILYMLLVIATLLHYKELKVDTSGVYYDITTICILLNFLSNKSWPTLFFKMKMYFLSALSIVGILITGLLVLIFVALNEVPNKWVVFAIFFIYQMWCSFALVLNIMFYVKEKEVRKQL